MAKLTTAGIQTGPAADAARQWVRCETEGPVRLIIYDRQDRNNPWTVGCVQEVLAAIRDANDDPGIGAMVLTGEGATYCSGSDLNDAPQFDPETGYKLTAATYTMGQGEGNWISVLAASKPMVAAVNGPAIGIGATHTLACDIRVMAQSAWFSFPFLKIGAMPECGSTGLLPRLIGAGRATDVLLRSGRIEAAQALEWGLVTQIFVAADLRAGAVAIARELAEAPRLQMQLARQMLAQNAECGDADTIMRNESRAFVKMFKAAKASRESAT